MDSSTELIQGGARSTSCPNEGHLRQILEADADRCLRCGMKAASLPSNVGVQAARYLCLQALIEEVSLLAAPKAAEKPRGPQRA